MNKTNGAFLLTRFPGDEEYKIRVCLPGLDDGRAVWLEFGCGQLNLRKSKSLLRRVVIELNKGKLRLGK